MLRLLGAPLLVGALRGFTDPSLLAATSDHDKEVAFGQFWLEDLEDIVVDTWPSLESVATAQGLPGGDSKPKWLIGEDMLVVDARKKGTPGMLLIHTVMADFRKDWGEEENRPAWLLDILAANKQHCVNHNHAMVLRWKPRLEFPPAWVREQEPCAKKQAQDQVTQCYLNLVRESYNWEKHKAMIEYLKSDEKFSHVVMMDADAALVQPGQNTFQQMAAELDKAGKDLFVANEDWLGTPEGTGRINGGMLFAKNTQFSQHLFEDMLASHMTGGGIEETRIGGGRLHCGSNEQLCIGYLQHRKEFAQKVLIKSGLQYNCGAREEFYERLHKDNSDLHIMHFMGGTKTQAEKVLCHEEANIIASDQVSALCGKKVL